MSEAKELATRLSVPELGVELALNFFSEAQIEYATKVLREQGRLPSKYEYELFHLFGIPISNNKREG